MIYTITLSDGTVLTTVAETTINTSATSLSLVGYRAVGYGQAIADNLVALIENFASPSAPANPLAGQIWYNKQTKQFNIYDGGTFNTIATLGANSTLSAGQLVSTCNSPLAPIVCQSNVVCTNLNAQYLTGFTGSQAATANTVAIRNGVADLYANKFQGTAVTALYADLAERFEASELLEAGDVVQIGGDKEICRASDPRFVLGVISKNPGLRMNEGAGDDTSHPFVAYTGRVPCKVSGTVTKGQPLVLSSIAGVARGIQDSDFANAMSIVRIGYAMEEKTTNDVCTIEIVCGVR